LFVAVLSQQLLERITLLCVVGYFISIQVVGEPVKRAIELALHFFKAAVNVHDLLLHFLIGSGVLLMLKLPPAKEPIGVEQQFFHKPLGQFVNDLATHAWIGTPVPHIPPALPAASVVEIEGVAGFWCYSIGIGTDATS